MSATLQEKRDLLEELLRARNAARIDGEHIHGMFERWADLAPDSIAVALDDLQITYRAVELRANNLAHYLRNLGVGPDIPIAICLERSPDMVVALLGVLKAGAAYVPLDPAMPVGRLGQLISGLQPPVILTTEALRGQLPSGWAHVVAIDSDWSDIARQPSSRPRSDVSSRNLAYVLYTSGSTGTPKGVGIEHRNLVNYVTSVSERFQFGRDVHAMLSTFAADLGNTVLFGSLCNGGTLHPVNQEVARDGRKLGAYFERHGVDTVKITPSHLAMLLGPFEDSSLIPLKSLVLGGEASDPLWVAALRRLRPECRIWNHYGPTETTVGVLTYPLAAGIETQKSAPVGRPLRNTQAYPLDASMSPVATGLAGELYIGGANVARGYHMRPAETAERFLPDPFSSRPGARLYRTGDLVKWLPDGALEFLGRADDQIKVRGFRVEPGEIEAALQREPGVQQARVILRGDAPGESKLVGYVVADPGEFDSARLLATLANQLPEYMIPAALARLDSLPLTANGKLDRKALPPPLKDDAAAGDGGEAPRGVVEEILAGIWAEVLHVAQVGRHANFFNLGGHSLTATQVVTRISRAFHVDLPLQAIFDQKTLSGVAGEVERLLHEECRSSPPPLVPVETTANEHPLSFAQQRLWVIDRMDPGNTAYNSAKAFRLKGDLDIAGLRRSLNAVVRRHAILRTCFPSRDGQPIQHVQAQVSIALPLVDLTQLESQVVDRTAAQIVRNEAGLSFDLSTGPLIRLTLLRLGSEDHILAVTMHHIISDAWSTGVLLRELGELYDAAVSGNAARLPELPVQYSDYSVWQRGWLRGETLDRQLDFWRGQLAGLEPLNLPADHSRPSIPSYRGAVQPFKLDADLSSRLHAVSRRENATLFMLLLAAWQVLLSRYSGQDDIAVGTPIAGRNQPATENLAGMFINTLVVRTVLAGDEPFTALLHRVRATALAAYAHQDIPFELLVEELQPRRDMSRHPLFQVMLVLQNGGSNTLALKNLSLSDFEVDGHTAKFDLLLGIVDAPEGFKIGLEYATDLFDQPTAERLTGHLVNLLTQIAAEPDKRIADLTLLGEAERHQILAVFNQTRADYPRENCIHRLFEEQVQRTPHAPAVIRGGRTLTYSELNARANQLARHLKIRGVGPEERVGILLSRSPEMVVALFAVLKAGGAYLPLDPEYPQDRLSFMLEDSGARIIITEEKLADRLVGHSVRSRQDLGHGSGTDTARPSRAMGVAPGPTGRMTGDAFDGTDTARPSQAMGVAPGPPEQVIRIDRDWDVIGQGSGEDFDSGADAGNLAYVIYTSGSTGTPKGVAIAHRSAAALIAWAHDRFEKAELACVLAGTSICFDLSVFEIFVPLSCGGRVVVAAHALELASLSDECGITLINTVPSAITELLRQDAIPPSVRVVNLAGEPLTRLLADQLYERTPNAKVFDLYGPSEDTTYTTCALRTVGGPATIGSAISNSQVYILNAAMEPAPVGVPGELYTGGDGLARGYLGRADLTAERFIPNPFSDVGGERLYRTGDRARWFADGNIEFLGRIDHQVKIRGFRIELGEIETALMRHPAVSAAVVTVHEASAGDKRLAAYVAVHGEADATELRTLLRGRLPEYMVPASFTVLDGLPLTPNGKVDRKALPAPDASGQQGQATFVGPRTSLERQIAGAWKDILKLEQIGIEDSFFDLGGNSLLAVQLHSRLTACLEIPISIMDLFQYPTVKSISQHLSGREGAASQVSEAIVNRSQKQRQAIRKFAPVRGGREVRR